MAFNDATLTGNCIVLREKAAAPFRKQLPTDKLKSVVAADNELVAINVDYKE